MNKILKKTAILETLMFVLFIFIVYCMFRFFPNTSIYFDNFFGYKGHRDKIFDFKRVIIVVILYFSLITTIKNIFNKELENEWN